MYGNKCKDRIYQNDVIVSLEGGWTIGEGVRDQEEACYSQFYLHKYIKHENRGTASLVVG